MNPNTHAEYLENIAFILSKQMRDLYEYYSDESLNYAYQDYYFNLQRLSLGMWEVSLAYLHERFSHPDEAVDWWERYFEKFGDWN